ncbi:hypothetical protein [Kribbella deserti]|uniref:Uncharacterized protein n=1 Tax=Kribbella deserti TaxID=1926257 RepID=A0ABV6QIX3_9ACTN
MKRTLSLFTGVVLAAGSVFVPTASAAADPCLDNGVGVSVGDLTDKPAKVGFAILGDTCEGAAVTVQKANGTARQKVALPTFDHQPGWIGTYGSFLVPLSGAGTWQVTHQHLGAQTRKLPTPKNFVVRRASIAKATHTSDPILPGQSATIVGWAKHYNANGSLVALANKKVVFRDADLIIGTSRTDGVGKIVATVKIPRSRVFVHVESSNPLIENGAADVALKLAPRPTSITGIVGPTAGGVVRPGSKMSTYGTLKVLRTTGQTTGFYWQKVLVQTRPRSNPSAPYTTVVTTERTSDSGYYYANWTASVDVDVRVAYISPYADVKSVYRYLKIIDVQ